ncbi:hypothetical protein LF65_03553 [Clostridium beijerinckii]|uniref:Uncharacterized protein n=1 Tax=Clostridium beijerinckii TaxID=1520 RepID=A0A0B5QD12_CLOBE|nr:hypothetical protein [Clostridium beijerinckii]AJH00110.1 hypothetical protein LF65_03553 [Clostridium beijerinckii]
MSRFLNSILDNRTKQDTLEINDSEFEEAKKIIDFIGEPVIRSVLQEKLKMAIETVKQYKDKSRELKEIIEKYDELSDKDQKELIKYIINKEM